MEIKANLPKGMRDFSSAILQKRKFILTLIRRAFEKYAYNPIETPAMENLITLTGKYGDEGDRLIYKILNSGDYLLNTDVELLTTKNSQLLTRQISEKGLRYDLTVPFARYVASHRNDLIFPFRRYQIQPVWRADRPQKGRYREFYQCDADVIGSTSLWLEIELLQIYDEVFSQLNIPVEIKINHRKILMGIVEMIGETDKFQSIIGTLDKLDKIGKEKIFDELKLLNISTYALQELTSFISCSQQMGNDIQSLKSSLSLSEVGKEGIAEMAFIIEKIQQFGLQKSKLQFDITLARGLNYYTGTIFEVKATGMQIGSLGGGGRYDNLTRIFGLKDISGVGISFGLDRIYMLMDELHLFPILETKQTKVLFVNFGEQEAMYCMEIIHQLRKKNVVVELYPDPGRIKKQMQYADRKKMPFVVLAGSKEAANNQLTLKDMNSGEQQRLTIDQLIATFTH